MHQLVAPPQISVWSQLAHAVAKTERLEDIYEAALEALSASLGVHRSSILLFDPDGVMGSRPGTACRRPIVTRSKDTRRGPTIRSGSIHS